MKRTILFLSMFVFAAAAYPAAAQVAPAATGRRPSLTAGGTVTYTQPYYDDPSKSVTSSSNHLIGVGFFADYRLSRWIQLEAEGRWQHWNQYTDQSVHESTYAIGLREPIHTFHRITPYGKALVGIATGSFLNGHAGMYVLGGGADYRLNKRFSLRACDFEYQHWRVSPKAMSPYSISAGISYKIF